MVVAVSAVNENAKEGTGPKPEQGEIGGSGSGSSLSHCDEPIGDYGSTSVSASPRLPCSSTAMDEESERDHVEQAAIASIILQLSQQQPVAKRRRVRNAPAGAHSDNHESSDSKHGGGGDSDPRRSRCSANVPAMRSRGGNSSTRGSQPATPQPPPSTPIGGLASIPSFSIFPDPVARGSGSITSIKVQQASQPSTPSHLMLPQLSLSDSMQELSHLEHPQEHLLHLKQVLPLRLC
jgi:hypothetical protein